MPKFKTEYRLPKKGDGLFRESRDLDNGVDFPLDENYRHVFIWDGYLKAGNLLIQACEENNNLRHILIYPIIFNFRHAIELAMKWVFIKYGRYSSLPIDEDVLKRHDLWQLWKQCKKILNEFGSNSEEISYVEQLIKDFHDVDNNAEAFRYPIDKQGEVFPLPEHRIDLRNVRDVMEGLAIFFDGVDGQLGTNTGDLGWPI